MDKVFQFLSQNPVCTLATCSEDQPRATTMEQSVVNGSIMFGTSAGSIKAKNLAKNSKISLSAHNLPVYLTIDGRVEPLAQKEIAQYHQALFARHPEMKQMMEGGGMGEMVYYKLVPQAAYFHDDSKGMAPTEVIEY